MDESRLRHPRISRRILILVLFTARIRSGFTFAWPGEYQAGKLDAAAMWGPLAGYYARESGADLTVTPLLGKTKSPRMFYRITMGVRQGELDWKRQLNSLIRRNQDEIDAILRSYGVPLADDYGEGLKGAEKGAGEQAGAAKSQ